MKFILNQLRPTITENRQYENRIILDTKNHGEFIEEIHAEPVLVNGETIKSAWIAAREKLEESRFYYIENEGYFPKEKDEI